MEKSVLFLGLWKESLEGARNRTRLRPIKSVLPYRGTVRHTFFFCSCASGDERSLPGGDGRGGGALASAGSLKRSLRLRPLKVPMLLRLFLRSCTSLLSCSCPGSL